MNVGLLRSCYSAPCRWYPGGPVGTIRYYFTDGADWLPLPTVFHPYSQILDLQNVAETGEITGRGLRRWYRGDNSNELPGHHYEGTAADFAGEGVNPF